MLRSVAIMSSYSILDSCAGFIKDTAEDSGFVFLPIYSSLEISAPLIGPTNRKEKREGRDGE